MNVASMHMGGGLIIWNMDNLPNHYWVGILNTGVDSLQSYFQTGEATVPT